MSYVKTICPHCGQVMANSITIHYQKIIETDGSDKVIYRTVLTNFEISETLTLDDLVKYAIDVLKPEIKNGISINELYELLRTKCGIAKNCINDVIEKIKEELGLYSDAECLYFNA